MKECVQFYINGEWVDPVDPQHLDVINPATEESIAKIAMGNSEDVNKAVAAAKKCF
jgi:aldehyde dehydrogenase (NAD+)